MMIRNKFLKSIIFASSFVSFSALAANVATGEIPVTEVQVWSTGHLLIESAGAFDSSNSQCASEDQGFVLSTHVAYKQYLAMAMVASANGQSLNIIYDDAECLANRPVITRIDLISS